MPECTLHMMNNYLLNNRSTCYFYSSLSEVPFFRPLTTVDDTDDQLCTNRLAVTLARLHFIKSCWPWVLQVHPNMYFDDILLKVESAKFLNVTIQSGLSWADRMDNLRHKIASGVFALLNVFKYCNSCVLKYAY